MTLRPIRSAIVRNPSDVFVALFALPVTLTLDAGGSVAKYGYRLGQSNDGAAERRARNTKLERLEDVRLEPGDSASAVLYFRRGEDGACIPGQGNVHVEFRAEDGTPAGSTSTPPPPAVAAPDTAR